MAFLRAAKEMIVAGTAAYAKFTGADSIEQFNARILESLGFMRFDAARRRLIEVLTVTMYDTPPSE